MLRLRRNVIRCDVGLFLHPRSSLGRRRPVKFAIRAYSSVKVTFCSYQIPMMPHSLTERWCRENYSSQNKGSTKCYQKKKCFENLHLRNETQLSGSASNPK